MNKPLIRRMVASLAAAAMVAVGVSGIAMPAQAATKTLTIGYDSDPAPNGYDPVLYAAGQRLFYESLYDSLFFLDGKGGVTPGAAVSSSQPSDNLSINMVIRTGQKFSDGSALTPDVVKANLSRVFTDKKTDYPALQPFVAGGAAEIKSVTADSSSVTVTFAKAQANAAKLFTGASGMIVAGSQATINNKLGTAPVGSGPYTLVKAGTIKGNTYKLVKNAGYWNAAKYGYSNLVYKVYSNPQAQANAVATGQSDIAVNLNGSTIALLQERQTGLVTQGGNVFWLQFWNGGMNPPGPNPPVADKNVRLALSYATDRAALVKALFKGNRPTANWIPKGQTGFDADLDSTYAYNPTKAKQLLADAGARSLTVSTIAGNPGEIPFWTALAAQWAKVGVTLKFKLAANTDELFGAVVSQPFGNFNTVNANPAGFAVGVILNGFANIFHTKNAAIEGATYASLANPSATNLKALNNALVNEAWVMPYMEGYGYIGYNKFSIKQPTVGYDGLNPMLISIQSK